MIIIKVLLLLSAVVGLSWSQTGVCYQVRSYVQYYHVYVTASRSYSYGCWFLTCYGTSYSSQLQTRTRTVYYTIFGCCSGYQQNGGLQQCIPICYDCDSNHLCVAPYTCVCPDGWTGEDCSEDIDECETPDTCEQICTNNNGSYSCSCDVEYSLAFDLRACLGPPQNMSLNSYSPTSVQVSWDPPVLDSWDGDIQRYQISCSSPSGWSRSFVVSSHYHQHQVNSLTPFANYNCCVTAETTNGWSSSSCHTNMTLEDRPLDSPHNITVVNISAFALFIEWSRPHTPNGIITLYKVYVTYDNHSEDNFTVSGSKRSFVLDDLSPHQLIYVSMSASTAAGEGPTSMTLHKRTSQAVPTSVANLQLRPLSLNQIEVTWQPPDITNGILTGYEVTVYNAKLNYTYSVSLTPTIRNITISDKIGPFIPFTVSVQAFTHKGGGIVENQIVFTQEGVPALAPKLHNLSREDATTGQLNWDQLTLDELRGFLHSYIVVYLKFRGYTCVDINTESGETVFVLTDNATLTGLSPTAEYCVGVAASTAAGVGSFSQALLPVFDNFLFKIHFHGVHNCPQWVNNNPLEKISHIVDAVSEELSKICDCYLPTDYIGDRRMICNKETPNSVVLQGRLIAIKGRNVSELMLDLTQWVSTSPQVVVQGVQLTVDMKCSIELSELGDSKCVVIQDAQEMEVSQADEFPLVSVVVGIAVPLVLIALIVVAACGIIVLQRKTKTPAPPALRSPGGLPMPTPEKCDNEASNKAFAEEYELVDTNKRDEENIYESIPGQT